MACIPMVEFPPSTSSTPLPLLSFASLSDDIVVAIVARLEADPRDWARLSCVSTRFASILRNVCCRFKCSRAIPSVVSDLISGDGEPPGGWSALHKLAVCCPGPLHAGVLIESSDFGLERDIGPDEIYCRRSRSPPVPADSSSDPTPPCCWSLLDDLYFDTLYDASDSFASESTSPSPLLDQASIAKPISETARDTKRRKTQYSVRRGDPHLASGGLWSLSREQGNKLLASRFRGDCLYICDWPGCIHPGKRRSYMLFRGIFKEFRRSGVYRAIHDTNRRRSGIPCAFCACLDTWDLHSCFCLRRVFGFHEDGEPVVRAYVCDNGHVSGAWTERPMYA